MIERIFKSWKSTVLGLLIIASGVSLVLLEKATLSEATPFLVGILALIYKEKTKKEE